MSETAQFVFGDELTQKNKLDSIIPGKMELPEPISSVEVWTFRF